SASLPRPDAQLFELLHRLIGELSLWSVAPDDEHDDRVFAGLGCLDILESPDRSGWKRNNVERIEIDRLDIAFFVLPRAAPNSRHRDKGLVSVVVMHHWAFARLGAAIAEIEPLGNRNGRHPRRIVADRRDDSIVFVIGRLKADDIIQRPLATRSLAVGKPAIGTFEVFEPRHALHHVDARDAKFRQRFHVASSVIAGNFSTKSVNARRTVSARYFRY